MKSQLWLTVCIGLLFLLLIDILYSVTYVNINANIQGSGPVAWGDFDNDGNLDLMRLTYLSRNDGNDLLTKTPISPPNGSAVDFGDYNNEGFHDILINGSPQECSETTGMELLLTLRKKEGSYDGYYHYYSVNWTGFYEL